MPALPTKMSRAARALVKVIGFGSSTMLLAVTSLIAMPVMIRSSGSQLWGAIALGQAVGAVACLVASYGWAMTGPSVLARGGDAAWRREYLDAVRVKMALLVPVTAVAMFTAIGLADGNSSAAAAGAVSGTAVALSSNWVFAGLARPYTFLLLEIAPRVIGTTIGILLMLSGYSAIVGIICTTVGLVLAFFIVTVWTMIKTAHCRSASARDTSVLGLLRARRHGVASMVGGQVFLATPFAVLALLDSNYVPVYALLDRVIRLTSAGLTPIVFAFQGWVPRSQEALKRACTAIRLSLIFCGLFVIVFYLVAPYLFEWLGDGAIDVDRSIGAVCGLVVSLMLFDSVVSYAGLGSLGRFKAAATSTIVSIVVAAAVALILVQLATVLGGLFGLVAGLLAKILYALYVLKRYRRETPVSQV